MTAASASRPVNTRLLAQFVRALTVSAILLSCTTTRAAEPELRVVDAVRQQDAAAFDVLLKRGADVNVPQGDGATALHWAAYWDDPELTERLVRAGARVNAVTDLGATPLWVATVHGGAVVVDRLLKAGADPNVRLLNGETPLMTAARAGSVDTVRLLLAKGANPNVAEQVRGQTALMWAAAQRHPEVVKLLIEHRADINARSLVRRRTVKLKGTQPRSNVDGLVDENQGGFTALLFAAQQGDRESTNLLLTAGADANDTAPMGASALVVATHSGHPAVAELLLSKGAKPDADGAGYTALHAAVLRGDLVSVKPLLAHGANPNARILRATPVRAKAWDWSMSTDWIGATPFWLAAKFGELEIMNVLLEHGADPLLSNRRGTTPLMAAISGVMDRWGGERADRGYINKLPDAPTEERMILATVEKLAKLGVEVSATNRDGDTALHGAAARRLERVIQFLAEHGAPIDLKNNKGETPLTLALKKSLPPFTAIEGAATGDMVIELGDGRSTPRTAELLRKLGARDQAKQNAATQPQAGEQAAARDGR